MNSPKNSNVQNPIVVITVISFLVMGFVTVVALIFRPSGAIEMQFGGERGPKLNIDESAAATKQAPKAQ
jgi:hypothetical protein